MSKPSDVISKFIRNIERLQKITRLTMEATKVLAQPAETENEKRLKNIHLSELTDEINEISNSLETEKEDDHT